MSLTERRRYVRISINDTPVKFVDYSVTESMDSLCTVAEFTLAELPSPDISAGDEDNEGDSVLIEWIEVHEIPIAYALFGGTVSALDTTSEPWAMNVRCVDQMELTRKTKNFSDMDLTGMTEGEAFMALLDYCGVDYDPSDIADTGYVLGERMDVKWTFDGTTPASSVLQELNRVFRMSCFTIENNRVIRIPYDPVPDDDTGLFDEYEKGVNIDFNAHGRTYGDRDQVQNVWVVHGPAVENASNTCTSTVWARSEYGNLLVGSSRRARAAAQDFQSDLIQDEELAREIVISQMQQTNRLPDTGSAELALHPSMHQCAKISIIDPTYGIRADPRYFLVRSVTKTGTSMSLELTAGPPGPNGTVTHGVDKVCNDTHTDVDFPGDFDFLSPDFPPFDAGLELPDFEPPTIPGFDLTGGRLEALPIIYCDNDTYSDGFSISESDWQIDGTLTLNSASQRLTIGVTTDDGDYRLTIAGPGYYDGISSPALRYEMSTPDLVRSNVGSSPVGIPIVWLLRWTAHNKVLQCQVETLDFLIDDFAPAPDATMGSAVTDSSVSGSPTRTLETIEHSCDENPDIGTITVVGLVFANDIEDGSIGLACPISAVFSELDIEL